jgi:hypothetical protein
MSNENLSEVSTLVTANYMLANVSVRTYGGQRVDRTISDEVHQAKGAGASTGKYVRNMFGDNNKRIKAVASSYNTMRNFLYMYTLPWVSDTAGGAQGDRLLPTTDSLNFLREFQKRKDAAKLLRDEVANELPQIIADARSRMGSMAPPLAEYPTPDEFKRYFDVTMSMSPVPADSDFSRMAMPAKIVEGLQSMYAARMTKQLDNAKNDAVERTIAKLNVMVVQLTKEAEGGKTRMFNTMLSNVAREAGLLGAIGSSTDKALEGHAMYVIDKITSKYTDVSVFKGNAALSAEVATKASRAIAMLKGEALPSEIVPTVAAPTPSPEVDDTADVLSVLDVTPTEQELDMSQAIERKIPTSEGGSMPDGDAHLQVDIEDVAPVPERVEKEETHGGVSSLDFNPDDFML